MYIHVALISCIIIVMLIFNKNDHRQNIPSLEVMNYMSTYYDSGHVLVVIFTWQGQI